MSRVRCDLVLDRLMDVSSPIKNKASNCMLSKATHSIFFLWTTYSIVGPTRNLYKRSANRTPRFSQPPGLRRDFGKVKRGHGKKRGAIYLSMGRSASALASAAVHTAADRRNIGFIERKNLVSLFFSLSLRFFSGWGGDFDDVIIISPCLHYSVG